MGYVVGYGNVYGLTLRTSTGASAPGRLVIMAAVKNDVAVLFDGFGPRIKPDPAQHPNPAATPLVSLFDLIGNTVTWSGDPAL